MKLSKRRLKVAPKLGHDFIQALAIGLRFIAPWLLVAERIYHRKQEV